MKSPISSTKAWFERWHLPILVGIGATVLTLLVSQALAVREAHQFDLLMESGVRRVRTELQAGLKTRMHTLSTLAREWQNRFLPRRGDWESDVRLILSQSPGLESIAWVEPSGEQSWVYPPDTGLPALDLDSVRAAALERPFVTAPLRASDGRPRLRILAPLVEGGMHQGWLLATYRSRELLADVLANLGEAYVVTIVAGDVGLFLRAESAESVRPSGSSRQTSLELPGGLELEIWIEPSGEMLEAAPSFLPHLTLAGGLALSLLLALSLGLRNVASAQARALEVEIAEHERAEEEIRRLNAGLEERVRQRTAALTRSNEDLKQFASFLSHELRQPIGTQAIWVELLESEYAQALDEEGRRYLASIRSCTTRMSELISAQLALSAASLATAESEPVDLEAVVRGAVSDLSMDLDAVGAKVRVGSLPTLRGDARQLYQLFRNLLENAIKYRREEAPVEISIVQRTDAVGAPADGLEIAVEDNGRGFPVDEAERIFAPLERLGAEDAEGQGLGLALCRTIVERHGGRLTAEGRPGDGATFRIAFPRDRQA